MKGVKTVLGLTILVAFNSATVFSQHDNNHNYPKNHDHAKYHDQSKSHDSATVKDEPAARKLLLEARSSRATWNNTFPGFAAKLTFTENGEAVSGEVKVAADGAVDVSLEKESKELKWIERTLHSMAMHRLERPFEDGDGKHALTLGPEDGHKQGQLLFIHGDGMDSSYRIKDGQIRQVNRTMHGMKFTIDVLETMQTTSGKYLPSHFVMTDYDPKTNEITKTVDYTNTFVKVGAFYLPESRKSTNSENEDKTVRELRMSEHQLLSLAAKE